MVDLLMEFEREEAMVGARPGGHRQQPLNPFDEEDSDVVAIHVPAQRRTPRKKQEYPIFRREDPNFHIPSGIMHMAVSNSFVTMVMVGNIIYRFSMQNPGAVEHYEIKREDDRIHRIFQDPSGQHLLVCMESKECYYIGRGGKRTQPRLLPKVKGQLIESVAWNKVERTETGTGPILLGTNNGAIFETDISFEESIIPKRKGYFHEVYQLMHDISDHNEPITGLVMEPFPSQPVPNEVRYFILATTPKRIYQFIGTVFKGDCPQFIDLFAHYDAGKVQFLEIPGNLKDSQLHVWPSQPSKTPLAFAWLTGAGIYYGTLGFGDHVPGESLFLEKSLIPYPHDAHSEITMPVGMCLTKFHCLLLYRDRVEAICVLNEKRVFVDPFNVRRDGPLHAMCMDPIDGTIYTHQRSKAWVYTPFKESRNVWKIYLEQGQYELAKQYAEGTREYMDTILIRQAEHYFKQGRYQDAAVTFSQSQLSFEEVTLKFIQVNRKDALKTFLHKKLESLGEKESTQQTMLTTWLIELYLNELGGLKDEGDMDGHKRLQRDFHTFLEKPSLRECLEANRKTVYDLISSHGAVDDIVFFAILMRDYERVITHCIQQYRYKEALTVLTDNAAKALEAPEKERGVRFKRFSVLFYKFSPVLMQQCALETVESWIRMGKFLEPKKLIPALIQCNQPEDPNQVTAAIRYLEFCVHKLNNTDRAIHNFLVSVYAKSPGEDHRKKLLKYLADQYKLPVVQYDPQYALRLCTEQSLDEASVHIYAAMGLYEEAIDLALKVDVELARMIAGTTLRDKELQKKLWLKIAQHVIKKEEDVEKAMVFLRECSLLKIEDILPFFPDFATIDHFKDAICMSLTEYNAHIDDLKAEMQGATDSAKNIRSDIQDIRNKCVVIQSDTKCQICETRLLTQGFYMFPCQHAFHRDCLIQEVRHFLADKEKTVLDQLLMQFDAVGSSGGDVGGTRGGGDDLKVRIDAIVGAECLYCGDMMIRSINKPFIPWDQYQASLDSWK